MTTLINLRQIRMLFYPWSGSADCDDEHEYLETFDMDDVRSVHRAVDEVFRPGMNSLTPEAQQATLETVAYHIVNRLDYFEYIWEACLVYIPAPSDQNLFLLMVYRDLTGHDPVRTWADDVRVIDQIDGVLNR